MNIATNEKPHQDWYWCDMCRDHFYGSAALIHKGKRCWTIDEQKTAWSRNGARIKIRP